MASRFDKIPSIDSIDDVKLDIAKQIYPIPEHLQNPHPLYEGPGEKIAVTGYREIRLENGRRFGFREIGTRILNVLIALSNSERDPILIKDLQTFATEDEADHLSNATVMRQINSFDELARQNFTSNASIFNRKIRPGHNLKTQKTRGSGVLTDYALDPAVYFADERSNEN